LPSQRFRPRERREAALRAAIEALRTRFGPTIIRAASDLARWSPGDDRPLLSTGALGLDLLTGGLPRGGISEYAGRDGSGRETLAAVTMAQAQAAGGLAILVDAGGTADPDALTAAMWLLKPGLIAAVLTVGVTVVWLVGKEIIRRRLYRPFGDASETWPPSQRRRHLIGVSFVATGLAVLAVLIVLHVLFYRGAWSTGLPYLVFCLVTPWIAWRYLRTDNELMVGLFLLFASAITSAGFVPDLALFTAILPLYSVILITVGTKEHRQFQALAARLRARQRVGA
jgi:hypothetical protein